MRKLRFVLIPAVLFLLPGLTQAGWFWQNTLVPRVSYYQTCFVDNNTGYAVGDFGTIVKTTDRGASWAILTSGTTQDLLSIHFPLDAQTGYAAGYWGTILKTTNGGATWAKQTSGTGINLR